MFLIEIDKGSYIDGETVNWVKITPGSVLCTQVGDADHIVEVTGEYQQRFINNLEAINDNHGIEKQFHELRK